MTEQQWDVVDEVAGPFQADIIQGLLQAQEIPVLVSKPGAGSAIGVTVGALGRVQILVPVSELERARELIDAYYSGIYQEQELLDLDDEIPSTQESGEDK